MYSPLTKKSSNKDQERLRIKEQKKAQLCLLLVNKFRNKFNVVASAEQHIDQRIIERVQSLLGSQDSATQNGLKHLDQQLQDEITKMRAQKRESPASPLKQSLDVEKASVKSNLLNQIDARSAGAGSGGARSGGARSSMKSSNYELSRKALGNSRSSNIVKPANGGGHLLGEPLVYHEDESAKLNINESQWNQIVQNNLKKFEEEKVQAKEKKFAKALTIQQEQLRQVEEKKQKRKEEKLQELDYFNNVGKNASNKYYVNQDKKDQQKADARGGSRTVAEHLRAKNLDVHKQKYQAMREAAEQRKQEQEEYAEAERQKKQEIADKKASLRKVQDADAMAKQNFRNRESKLADKKDDFNDQHILSYVYETKKNKSHEYDQKKQATISKIVENFPVHNKIENYSKKLAGGDDAFNPTQGPSDQEREFRKMTKKKKEMEAKLFQDQQVREKKAMKDAIKREQDNDYARLVKDVETFKQEEAQKKVDALTKQKNHLDLMKKQMLEPNRTFAKTGVAVIKNTGTGSPQIPI